MNGNLVIKDFKSLKVWQKANALEQEIGESETENTRHVLLKCK